MKNTARAILNIDGKYVFIKRTAKPNSKYDLFYAFPGGHLDDGENFEDACIRELYEELGVNVKIKELFYEQYNEDLDKYEKFFIVEYIDGIIGTGKGEEFTNLDASKYGEYEVVMIEKERLNEYNILPLEVKKKLMD